MRVIKCRASETLSYLYVIQLIPILISFCYGRKPSTEEVAEFAFLPNNIQRLRRTQGPIGSLDIQIRGKVSEVELSGQLVGRGGTEVSISEVQGKAPDL